MTGRPRSVSDDAIFEAVAAVVTAVGPAGLTLATVAERVGLSAPALTQRFGSKHGLLVAFATREATSVADIFTAARAAHPDPLTALVSTLAALPSGITTREGLANNLAFMQLDLTDPELRSHAVAQSQALRAEIATLVTDAVQAGQLAADTAPETLAADLYATYCGAMLTWAIDGSGTLPGWLGEHLERTVAPHHTRAPGDATLTGINHDARAVLDQLNASMPAPADFDVATFRAMVEDHPAPPSSIALAAIENLTIPGDAPVPARLYRPNLDADRPAIVFIHGGGFIQRGLDSHDELCRRLAAGTDSVVIAVDCRPAPEHPYPAAVDDAYTAIGHIANGAGPLGLDASRIALAGISSGAAVAAGTALQCREAGGPPVALQVLLTPMLRHREATPSRQTYGQGDHGITAALLDWYSDQYAPGTTADEPYCAPLRATDLHNLPSAYIHTAELDPLRDDGVDYTRRLRSAGVHVEHHDAAGLFHGFHFFTDAVPPAHDEVTIELDAIRRMLTGRSP